MKLSDEQGKLVSLGESRSVGRGQRVEVEGGCPCFGVAEDVREDEAEKSVKFVEIVLEGSAGEEETEFDVVLLESLMGPVERRGERRSITQVQLSYLVLALLMFCASSMTRTPKWK